MPAFGDLRSLLHAPPSAAAWRRLCAQLDLWEDGAELREHVLPYCEDMLREWPDALRSCDPVMSWAFAMLTGADQPRLRLVRTFRVFAGTLVHHLGTFLENPHARRLRYLHIHSDHSVAREDAQRVLARALRHEALGQLVGLSLSGVALEVPGSAWRNLSALRELTLRQVFISREALDTLITHAPGIERLHHHGPLHLPLLRAIASAPWTQLRALELPESWIGDVGVEILADAPSLSALHTLNLNAAHMGHEGVSALAASPHLRQLHTLSLRGDEGGAIGALGARALAESAALASVRALDLESNRIGDAGLRALATSPHLGPLRTLNLRHNTLTPDGLRALAAEAFDQLEHLELASSAPGGAPLDTITPLHDNPRMCASLRALSVRNLGPDGARALIEGPITELRALDANLCALGDEGVAILTRDEDTLRALHTLQLEANRLTGASLHALATWPGLAHIERLSLAHNARFDDADLLALWRSPHAANLQEMSFAAGPDPMSDLDQDTLWSLVTDSPIARELRARALPSMTATTLKRLAKHLGITGYSRMPRQALVDAIGPRL